MLAATATTGSGSGCAASAPGTTTSPGSVTTSSSTPASASVSTASAPSSTANALTTQTEKPLHYTYLKEFRVEQCPLFLQHKCTQHKPFTCFYWHFNNQRRRRPIRRRDGTFNYSPDVYCTKYDETTGICPDGDECPYLHRTAGDTERRYHLRYYKTGICVYDTDSRGYCVKNGPHCAFAHGIHDLRNPVYDIRELQAMESGNGAGGDDNGPNSLDKERNALNEDPRWNDTAYVLANYKTELCKRPPRLCRQGYACPQYHNNKDRRRSPKKFKYRSTPCPNVKQGDEWGDPANCESGDSCPYCHTRTEQQFHPEIYKSTKCNDILQTGYCPRGAFCAFAHVDADEIIEREGLNMDSTPDLASFLSNAFPPSTVAGNHQSQSNSQSNQRSVAPNSCSTTNTITAPITISKPGHNISGSNIAISATLSDSKLQNVASSLPEHLAANCIDFSGPSASALTMQPSMPQSRGETPTVSSGPGPIARPRSYSTSASMTGPSLSDNLFSSFIKRGNDAKNLIGGLPSLGLNGPSSKAPSSSLFGDTPSLFSGVGGAGSSLFSLGSETEMHGPHLEDLHLEDLNLDPNIDLNPINNHGSASEDNIGGFFPRNLGPSAGSTAPVNIPGARLNDHNNLGNLTSPPLGAASASPLTTGIAPNNSFGISPFTRPSVGQSSVGGSSSFFDSISGSVGQNISPASSAQSQTLSAASMIDQRIRAENPQVENSRIKLTPWEDNISNIKEACEVWKREAEEASRREQQREETLAIGLRLKDIENLSITQLQQIKQKLKTDLDHIESIIYQREHPA